MAPTDDENVNMLLISASVTALGSAARPRLVFALIVTVKVSPAEMPGAPPASAAATVVIVRAADAGPQVPVTIADAVDEGDVLSAVFKKVDVILTESMLIPEA
jgi:hypothetical protein